jgi:hypothetical protein
MRNFDKVFIVEWIRSMHSIIIIHMFRAADFIYGTEKSKGRNM